MKHFEINLQLFADFVGGQTAGTPVVQPVNVTTQSSMNPTMKTFYDTTLLENAREEMIFTQFGKKQPMKGNKVEWRKFNTFAKATTPLAVFMMFKHRKVSSPAGAEDICAVVQKPL